MSKSPMSEEELANLSDDDIMNMAAAPVMAQEEKEADADPDVADDAGSTEDDPGVDGSEDPDTGSEDDKENDPDADPDAADNDGGETNPDLNRPDDEPVVEKPVEGEKKKPAKADEKPEVKAEEDTSNEPVDYKAAYDKIMGFKAAGKNVVLKSVDDAVQLMQLGTHYTKKMQALQPNLKLLRMLENNQLLDEGKLSFLIDISRKDPAAIQKMVRESGVDPMDIDTSVEPEYRAGKHKVTDAEMVFTSTLEEVASEPVGKNLIVEINRSWDKASKDELFKDPTILRHLKAQKSNGIFDQISTEIDRRRTLGYLRNEPFLQAYESVGKEMDAQGRLTPVVTDGGAPPVSGGQPNPDRRIVETRKAPRTTVSNNERARAASPTKSAGRKPVAADFNPLSMSDEDFEKNASLANKL